MKRIRQLFQSRYKNNIEKALDSLNHKRLLVINEMNTFKYHLRNSSEYARLSMTKHEIENNIKLVSELLK